ncbi:uncharacterized protein LOC130494599 [Raphanus sativus]|uniref:Uncharacterized protein LOC130494599 n=1 Tax=Raphanus sativus TaxID=3726 RepID=A0A9W3CS12_RAPSA|nr:uncharacterized protein LOC130494599 [Raphanus sativus]
MDPSDSHQPFDFTTITNTYVPEGVTAPNISPTTTQTVNELNRVEANVEPVVQPHVEPPVQPHVEPAVQPHVEPAVQPHVEPAVQPHVEPHAASESALVQAQPSSNRRPYTDMIYEAVVALNEPRGSSKSAISSYIKRLNPNLPDGHEALMTHHLEVMKRCGILTMVRKSYMLADSSPPENVAVAPAAVNAGPVVASGSETPPGYTGSLDMLANSAAAVDTRLVVVSGSEIPPTDTRSLDMLAVTASASASQPLKRGRGRPPKPKTEAPQQQQPIAAQPIPQALQPSINVEPSDVQPSEEQPELPVTDPTVVVTESAKRGPGRPRKDGSGPSVQTPSLAVMMKRRGWPMSCRGSGREREPISVPAPDSVIPDVGGSGGVATLAPAGEEAMAVAAVMKRGPGRPPKRGRGRAAARPIQDTPRPVTRATGTIQELAYGELKRKINIAIQFTNLMFGFGL